MAIRPNRLPLLLSTEDYNQLVLLTCLGSQDPALATLMEKLRRAELCRPDELPADVVGLGAWVTYHSGRSPRATACRLVSPTERAPRSADLSVLTPLGTALIGLRQGCRARYRDPRSGVEMIFVANVCRPARRYGASGRAALAADPALGRDATGAGDMSTAGGDRDRPVMGGVS